MSRSIAMLTVLAIGSYLAPQALADETPAPPKSGTVPNLHDVPPAAVCPPLSDNDRLTQDKHPGRAAIGGGVTMIVLGAATVAAGTALAVESSSFSHDDAVLGGGITTAVLGGISLIGGIPLTAYGARQSRKAKEDAAHLTVAPIGASGGSAQVGGRF
jgi:hypothetical protein